MWDEIAKSVKANLYERTTSPLFGAYTAAWCIWNYKFLLMLVSELPIREKLDALRIMFFPGIESYIYAFGAPLIGAILFIFLYPYPARYVYEFWRKQQKILKEVRQRIDDETPLTKEEARELRHSLYRMEDENQKEISKRNTEIQRLREQLQSLQEPVAKEPVTYLVPNQARRVNTSDEYLPTNTQLELLKQIAESKKGNLSGAEIHNLMRQSATKTDFDIGELHGNGFIQVTNSNEAGPVYAVTHPGRKALVSRGLV